MKTLLLALVACRAAPHDTVLSNHVGGKPPVEVVWVDTWEPKCKMLPLLEGPRLKCWYVRR